MDDTIIYLVFQSFTGNNNSSLSLSAFKEGHKLLSYEDYNWLPLAHIVESNICSSFYEEVIYTLRKHVTLFPNDGLMLSSISHNIYVCSNQRFENYFLKTNKHCWQKGSLGTAAVTPLHGDRPRLWEDDKISLHLYMLET